MGAFVPESVVSLRQGYGRRSFFGDLAAGLTVGVIALPLAMAFGIASIPESAALEAGVSPPAIGLYTAVVAGFLISALGGSRVQIGGPTGAFIVIVYGVASRHGYAGLATATLMAGVIIVLMGLARFGTMIKFIPYPVTTGFTGGIALVIASSQVRELLGLPMEQVPPEFLDKWREYLHYLPQWHGPTAAVAAGSLALLVLLRRFVPRLPWGVVTVTAGAAMVWWLDLPVETIGSRFGEIPRVLPTPHLPPFDPGLIRELIPEATTIAILAAIESLLSAVVADGMTGARHRSDCELVAQGLANIGAVVFGGMPATGAIARTTANVKSGARTPVAGMIHAGVLLLVMFFFAPLAGLIPLATLAAVLLMVAWNMSEIGHFRRILRAPRSDAIVLLTTFGLTVLADLTIAVGVGMILASILFMKRMAEVSGVAAITADAGLEEAAWRTADGEAPPAIPPDVEVYEVNGPFFFGVADRLQDTLRGLERPPRAFILRMRRVPTIDATGLHALEDFHRKCVQQGTTLILSGVQPSLQAALRRFGFEAKLGAANIARDIGEAIARAKEGPSSAN